MLRMNWKYWRKNRWLKKKNNRIHQHPTPTHVAQKKQNWIQIWRAISYLINSCVDVIEQNGTQNILDRPENTCREFWDIRTHAKPPEWLLTWCCWLVMRERTRKLDMLSFLLLRFRLEEINSPFGRGMGMEDEEGDEGFFWSRFSLISNFNSSAECGRMQSNRPTKIIWHRTIKRFATSPIFSQLFTVAHQRWWYGAETGVTRIPSDCLFLSSRFSK